MTRFASVCRSALATSLAACLTACLTASFTIASAGASLPSTRRVCQAVVGSGTLRGSVCATVSTSAKKISLKRIQFVGNARDAESGLIGATSGPIRFRRGTAAELCRIFHARSEAVTVEVFHANGVSLPGLSRALAASAPPITSYEEVACLR